MAEFNFVLENGNNKAEDKRLFFQDEETQTLPPGSTMLDIVIAFNAFPSRGQAKKAGWAQPIPEGFSFFEIGKLKHQVWILNPKVYED